MLTLEIIRDLSDDELISWIDASTCVSMIQHDRLADKVKWLEDNDTDYELASALDDEEERRDEYVLNGTVSHILDQDAARRTDRRKPAIDHKKLMEIRAARLLRLLQLNAPPVIIDTALKCLAQMYDLTKPITVEEAQIALDNITEPVTPLTDEELDRAVKEAISFQNDPDLSVNWPEITEPDPFEPE